MYSQVPDNYIGWYTHALFNPPLKIIVLNRVWISP